MILCRPTCIGGRTRIQQSWNTPKRWRNIVSDEARCEDHVKVGSALTAEEKLRNSSLWLLSGQERIVYDLTRQMELGNAGMQERTRIDIPWTDVQTQSRSTSSSPSRFTCRRPTCVK